MKQFLLAIILIHAATSCKLNLGAQVNLVDNVLINCQGAQNHVTYGVQNLPSGVRLHNNRLEVFDNSRVTSGQYPVRIRAFENGQVLDEQVVVIVLGPQTGNFGRGIRTISVS